MINQLGVAIAFKAFFTASGVGATGLTVTVDVYEGTNGTPIVSGGSATEMAGGMYQYTLSSGSVDATGDYTCIFKTAGTADQQHLPGIAFTPAWVDHIDTDLSTLATAANLATVDGIVDDILVDTGTTLPAQITGLNNLSQAEAQAAAAAALTAYDPPTNAELEARTLLAAAYFDPATDGVIVTTNNDKTGYGLADDAITAAKFDETTAFPLKADDFGATLIARTGADADTLKTLSDQIDTVGTAANQTTIITHLTDIKGTGFVKDTDSLVDLAHETSIAALNDLSVAEVTAAVPTVAQIVDGVWDEVITAATHNIATSAGRRLRELTDIVVWDGTAQGGASTYITLDAGASAVSGTYDPSIISIIDGTGAGQSRQIWEYDGATKRAYVNRDWKVVPDATSVFIIVSDAGDTHVNEGVAMGGGASTITLNSLASAINNTYNDQIVFIAAGTGADQAKHIISYDGATKIATVDSPWVTQPDTTSVYCVLPAVIHEPPTVTEITADIDANSTQLAQIINDIGTLNDFDPATDKVTLDNTAHGGAAATFTLSDYTNFQGAAGLTAAAIWQYDISGFAVVGQAGTYLKGAGAAGDPWIVDPSGYAEGTAGNILYSQYSLISTSNALVQAATNTETLNIRQNNTNAMTFVLGDITGWTKLWFTVKKAHSDPDADAIIQIDSATGLVRLNGAAGTALDGTVVVNNVATGNVTFTLAYTSSDDLRCLSNLYYDVQMQDATGKYTKIAGKANILYSVTKS